MSLAQKLQELNITLPAPPKPVGSYRPAVRTGTLVFTSGQLPVREGQLLATGKVPADVPLPQAAESARQAVLNALAAVAAEADLEKVSRVVRLNVFVNSSSGFTNQAQVANGASDLLVALFGEPGRHTRCAIGVAELPLNAPVELDLVVEIAE